MAGNYIGTDATGDARWAMAPAASKFEGAEPHRHERRRPCRRRRARTSSPATLWASNSMSGLSIPWWRGTTSAPTPPAPPRWAMAPMASKFEGHGTASARMATALPTTPSDNVISANPTGIGIQGGSFIVVAGNYIGTDASGTVRLKNESGIIIDRGSSDNRIGTNGDGIADETERNLISGNFNAVVIGSAGSDRNVVAGNYIGPDVTGARSLGYGAGVAIVNGPQDNRIERNIISGFDVAGVLIANINNVNAATDRNIVTDNYIGTDSTGTVPLGNFRSGVEILGKVRDNRVERNVIAANLGSGIALVDYLNDGQGPERTIIADNFIGTNASGISAGPGQRRRHRHARPGQQLQPHRPANVIVASTSYGVVITGTGNVLYGNSIGIDVSGAAAGNGDSVLVAGTGNVIGDVGPGLGNTIA